MGHYKEYLPGVVRNNNNKKKSQKSKNWMRHKLIWNNLLFICFDFLFISRSVCCFIYFSIVAPTLGAKDLTGYAAIKLAMYLISCISTNLSPPQRLPLGIPIMNNNNNNNNDDDDDDDDGGGGGGGDDEDDVNNARWTMGRGKRRERGLTSFSLSPFPSYPGRFRFSSPPPPSLPTTQKGVLATTRATIAKTSLLK